MNRNELLPFFQIGIHMMFTIKANFSANDGIENKNLLDSFDCIHTWVCLFVAFKVWLDVLTENLQWTKRNFGKFVSLWNFYENCVDLPVICPRSCLITLLNNWKEERKSILVEKYIRLSVHTEFHFASLIVKRKPCNVDFTCGPKVDKRN